jgi:magnesium-transporting ATPase (P-type)
MCVRAQGADGRIVPLDAGAVHDVATRLASRGLRVLAFAHRDAAPDERGLEAMALERAGGLVFLGLVGMLDPPREEAVRAVAACRAAGVRVKMITGDHAATAASIAGMMGIRADTDNPDAPPRVLTGAQMAAIADERLPDEAESTAVFARMTPEQKLRLVRALQGRGHIVAMTGDGVNDAPALKQADIGVAMGIAGTEAAKDAADIVLADDNFASIAAAVEEGRAVFDNLVKFIVWTLPTNGGQALVIVSGVALGSALPILPTHALYVNMATAVLLGIPLVFEAKDPGLMSRPPRDPRRPIFTFELFMRSGLVSILLCVASAGMFHWELARGESEASARTAAVTAIVVAQAFYLFSSRALLRPAWSVPLFSNGWLWAGIAAMAALQMAFVHASLMNALFQSAPLDGQAWGRIFAAGVAVLVIVEAEKAIRRLLGAGGEA